MRTHLATSMWRTGVSDWGNRLAIRWERAPSVVRDNARMLAGLALLLGVWRMSILALSLIWSRVGVRYPWPEEFAGMRLWRYSIRWDAEWYLQIAQHGYANVDGVRSSVAFFPGLPLAIRLFDALLPSGPAFAALVVVHLALIGAVIYVYLLARLDFGVQTAWWTIGLMLMFPAAIYFSAIYPQSMLLLGIAGALYHARRGQWWRAGVFGVVAGATSLAGLLLVVPLAMELRRWSVGRPVQKLNVVAIALSPLGGLAYLAYLWSAFGSPRVFSDSLKAWQTDTASSLIWNGSDYLRIGNATGSIQLGRDGALREVFVVSEITFVCAFLIAGAFLCWKVRPSYGVLVIAMTVVPLLVGSRLGMGGYVVVLFPVFILLGKISHEGARMTLSIVFTLGLTLTSFLFVQGFWAG